MTSRWTFLRSALAVLTLVALAWSSSAIAQPYPPQKCVVPETVVAPATPTKCLCPLGDTLTPDPAVAGGFIVNRPAQSGTCNIGAGPGVFQPLLPALQPKFAWDLPVPVFHVPDKTTFPGTDYYVVSMKEVTQLPVAFPQPATAAPANTQWLGLCSTAVGAFVPATPTVPAKCNVPWFTPVWGYAQENGGAIPGLATYPSMSFLAKKGTPVKVKWVNAVAANNHLFCPYPQNSNWPCAIDRTLMGTLFDPAVDAAAVINPFGTKMQPDNAMVVHLHGGEIPPDSDGFAELWIGNGNVATGVGGTADQYGPAGAYYTTPYAQSNVAGAKANISPPFLPPLTNGILTDARYAVANADPSGSLLTSVYQPAQLQRPLSNSIFYNYPMVQASATIWYHDHTLGKTRINVVAGPAGYFYVQEPGLDNYADPANGIAAGSMIATGLLPNPGDCSNGGILAGKCFDIPIVLQDRAFNMPNAACTDPACGGASSGKIASINFPNGLAQPVVPGVVLNSLTPGGNPGVHPQWVPEYFGDSAVVNGVIWPKVKVEPRPYRFRLLDGSNARCYTLSLKIPGAKVQPQMIAIGSDQGYLPSAAALKSLDMCPGERYDVVVDFSTLAGQQVFLQNVAPAPFPNGVKPNGNGPYAFLNQLVRFDVATAIAAGSPPAVAYTLPKALKAVTPPALTLMPPNVLPAGMFAREMVLNEVLDALTLQPLRVQIDGKKFEDAVTETPKRGTTEVWTIINTTGDAHPIHLHLVQFQVVGRQNFNASAYSKATGFAVPGNSVFTKQPIATFLSGNPVGPLPQELGFKDTVISYPGQITTVVARWDGGWADLNPNNTASTPFGKTAPACEAPLATDLASVPATPTTPACRCVQQPTCAVPAPGAPTMTTPPPGNTVCPCVPDATGLACAIPQTPIFAVPAAATCGATIFKPFWEPVTSGPYVWHCHIVDHEDNEMMRPSLVIP